MKKLLMILLLITAVLPAFSQTKCFVNTDFLKVRNAPSMQGTKTGTLKFGDVVNVYKTEGTGEYKNGILDKWCLISDGTKQQWVNYLYLSSFPAKADYEYKKEIHHYNVRLAPWANDIPEYVYIDDIIEENGVKYFVLSMYAFVASKTKIIKGIKAEVAPVIKNFLPSDYNNAIAKAKARTFSYDGESYYMINKNGNKSSIGKELPKNAIEIGKNEWKMGAPLDDLKVNELKIQDNLSLRKNSFCRNTGDVLASDDYEAQQADEDTLLQYGIKIGMKKSDLFELIGKPDEIETESDGETFIYYYDFNNNCQYTVFIQFSDDKISSIKYQFIK